MMKTKTLFAFLITLFCCGFTFAGEKNRDSTKYNGFTIGLSHYQIKERVLNNIRHTGTFFPSPLSFIHETKKLKSIYKLELNFFFSGLKSRYDPDKSSLIIHPDFNYRYLWKMGRINDDVDFLFGGIAGLNMHLEWYDNWDDSHLYWLTAYYVGIDAKLDYQMNSKSSFFIDVNSPLISIVSRPPERFLYKAVNPNVGWILSEIHEDARLTSINEHFALNFDLAYDFNYSKGSKLRIFWRIYYLNSTIDHSKDLNVITHTVGTSLLF